MSATTRFCKDCKHIVLSNDHTDKTSQYEYAHCAKSSLETMNVVSGVTGVVMRYCDMFRKSEQKTACGPEGRLFEPKENL